MKARELKQMGIPPGRPQQAAFAAIAAARQAGLDMDAIGKALAQVGAAPEAHLGDARFGALAAALIEQQQARAGFRERAEPAPYRIWGAVDLDPPSVEQLKNACRLPISVSGALMPDAHVGYGLPIGGVLATRNAVIPYAVGVDIACRMKLTVLDLPVEALETRTERLKEALLRETSFGVGAIFRRRREHPVMDEDWSFSRIVAALRDKAWSQLGTSGSGNHFAEYGTLTLERDELGLSAGTYLALLSHSGSRGAGNEIATHFSRVAQRQHPELPRELAQLAWLELASEAGQEYWRAMELMGRYAAANHELIHRHVAQALGVGVRLDLENHHNFAWREEYDGEPLIVHRKGATPAGKGAIGIIPGSMGAPGYVVRGKGSREALNSASHGAGRRMSRTQAKQRFTWADAESILKARGVTVLSAGLDEVPMVYKDIAEVMAAQADLVEPLARFDPKLVRMAPGSEKPED